MLIRDFKGGISGGTIASLFGAGFDEPGKDRAGFTDPYGLDPPDSIRGPDQAESLAPGYSPLHKSWHSPFMMAAVNTKVVRRSNALQHHAYGELFEASSLSLLKLTPFFLQVRVMLWRKHRETFEFRNLKGFCGWSSALPTAGHLTIENFSQQRRC